MNKAKVFQELAQQQTNIVLSGKSGDAIINQALDFGDREKKWLRNDYEFNQL